MGKFFLGLVTGSFLTVVAYSTFSSVEEDKKQDEHTYIQQPLANMQRQEPVLNIQEKKQNITPVLIENQHKQLKEESADLDENLIKHIRSLNEEQYVQLQSFLQNLGKKTSKERFISESTKSTSSLERQSELEYSFYQNASLKDLGVLKSIDCRTSICLVQITAPIDTKLMPSNLMDWVMPEAIEINSTGDEENPEQLIELYISME
ncbi:hypothetical protein [Pleionea sp. CnH1-48]|uniref:hypothetical protein n=1 Tax=Pleionea sp. CnH1-48 TaxID=2954494 RepID=UPI002097091D|nr:hypothetical protein [Pleionea sp. CnH1-48]MCO7226582.1 hypothetical protein [Pleionea sp. CnH1-48]